MPYVEPPRTQIESRLHSILGSSFAAYGTQHHELVSHAHEGMMYLCPKTRGNKHTLSSMPCELDFGNDFACDCPLPKNIIQMHTSESSSSSSVHSYYLRQMHMCQMGSRSFEIELSKPTSWGACFCRQYLEKKCELTRVIRNHRLLGDSTDKVILKCTFNRQCSAWLYLLYV
jgi:hypothetical protein